MQTNCTIGQLPYGDGHGFLLAESEEAFICFPEREHTHKHEAKAPILHCEL